jgi:hypothetical protein
MADILIFHGGEIAGQRLHPLQPDTVSTMTTRAGGHHAAYLQWFGTGPGGNGNQSKTKQPLIPLMHAISPRYIENTNADLIHGINRNEPR